MLGKGNARQKEIGYYIACKKSAFETDILGQKFTSAEAFMSF